MGTHPIFESDFDCLTDIFFFQINLFTMSMNGNWKKVKSDNAAAFGTAIGATKEQLEKAAKTVTTLTYKVTGNTITTSRTYTGPDGAKTVTNTGTIGSEAEYQFLEHKIPCQVTGKDGDLVLKAKSGWATAHAKLEGDNLTETITHHESGTTMVNTWARA